ncbi:HK97 gp10 family phage protein [Pyruvatibacter sp.]|uniref:HK97 gp10 family phage protein n=1 Tax=Pyruvatibacter sp. TaxID=1981328 RepID=UPI0032EB6731
MIRARVTIKGETELRRQLVRRARKTASALKTEVAATAQAVRSTAQAHLDNAAVRPVSQSGRLARSLTVVLLANGLVVRVGSFLSYGAHLEFGTRHMRAMPWLAPALDAHRHGFKQKVRAIVAKVMGARQS